MPTVYLAGTITPNKVHTGWRLQAANMLLDKKIYSISPIRGNNPADWTADGLDGVGTVYADGGFVPRDERDIRRCDAVLLFFMDPLARQSVGTWAEFGMAYALGKPVVVCSGLPEIAQHPFVRRWSAKVVPDMEAAVAYLAFLLED